MAQLNTKNFMKTAVDQTLKLIEVRTDQIHFNFFNFNQTLGYNPKATLHLKQTAK